MYFVLIFLLFIYRTVRKIYQSNTIDGLATTALEHMLAYRGKDFGYCITPRQRVCIILYWQLV